MYLAKWVGSLAVVCADLLAQPAQAQNTSPTSPGPCEFSLHACNNSGLALYFVLMSLNSVTDARFHIVGWYHVNAGECPHWLGNYPQLKLYYFAVGIKADNTHYLVEGTALQQCVDLSPDNLSMGYRRS